jgi:hypothetical protein
VNDPITATRELQGLIPGILSSNRYDTKEQRSQETQGTALFYRAKKNKRYYLTALGFLNLLTFSRKKRSSDIDIAIIVVIVLGAENALGKGLALNDY